MPQRGSSSHRFTAAITADVSGCDGSPPASCSFTIATRPFAYPICTVRMYLSGSSQLRPSHSQSRHSSPSATLRPSTIAITCSCTKSTSSGVVSTSYTGLCAAYVACRFSPSAMRFTSFSSRTAWCTRTCGGMSDRASLSLYPSPPFIMTWARLYVGNRVFAVSVTTGSPRQHANGRSRAGATAAQASEPKATTTLGDTASISSRSIVAHAALSAPDGFLPVPNGYLTAYV